jgi:multisubunit Na+/H+ antiporter MnhF subunit
MRSDDMTHTEPADLAARDAGGDSPSRHILPTSATMIGVCMTVIGLVKLIETRTGPSHIDEIFAVDALKFLASCFASYLSIRSQRHSSRFESIADGIFMIAMALMTFAGTGFAFELL